VIIGIPLYRTASQGRRTCFSGKAQPFEFFFEAEALRDFIKQGTKALAEMDALAK
jgi:hypothetical protein